MIVYTWKTLATLNDFLICYSGRGIQQQHSQAEPHEKPQKQKRQDKTQEKLEAKQ